MHTAWPLQPRPAESCFSLVFHGDGKIVERNGLRTQAVESEGAGLTSESVLISPVTLGRFCDLRTWSSQTLSDGDNGIGFG